MTTFKAKEYKYAFVFAITDKVCTECEKVETHMMAMLSNAKTFNKAIRVKQCDACGLVTEAPVSEG